MQDNENNLAAYYTYDTTGRLVRSSVIDTGKAANTDRGLYSMEYGYDTRNNMTRLINRTPNGTMKYTYEYEKDNRPKKMVMGTGRERTYKYDDFGWLSEINSTTAGSALIMWRDYNPSNRGGSYKTSQLGMETFGTASNADHRVRYYYDALGNINRVAKTTGNNVTFSDKYEYQYDGLSQLTAVIDKTNPNQWKKTSYTYNLGGNRTRELVQNIDSTGAVTGTVKNLRS